MIIGSLGKDPEVRATPSGQKVASFSVAVSEKFKDRNGQQQEKTEWLNIVIWGRLAEICESYLRKGSKVYLEGKISTSSWDDPQGQKRYKTEVICHSMQMLGGKSDNQATQQVPQSQPPSQNAPSYQSYEDDSLPF